MRARLKPDSAAVLRVAAGAGFPEDALHDVEASARYLRALREGGRVPPGGESVAEIRDVAVTDQVTVRVYRPDTAAKDAACVVYLHGGGWVMGDLDMHDGLCRLLANQAEAVVVSVDYRLAPEHPFPEPVHDVHDALVWVGDHADELGVDPTRLVLLGSSSGGNLAVAAALTARRRSSVEVGLLVLVYPPLDPSLATPSFEEYGEGHLLERNQMAWFWRQYLPRRECEEDELAVPARIEDLRMLPPTLMITAECDPLRDEGERFAVRLEKAGRLLDRVRYDGQIHGFLGMVGVVEDARAAVRLISDRVRHV